MEKGVYFLIIRQLGLELIKNEKTLSRTVEQITLLFLTITCKIHVYHTFLA